MPARYFAINKYDADRAVACKSILSRAPTILNAGPATISRLVSCVAAGLALVLHALATLSANEVTRSRLYCHASGGARE